MSLSTPLTSVSGSIFPETKNKCLWGQASQVHKIIISFIALLFITNKDLYLRSDFSTIINKKGQNKKIIILLFYSVLLPERFFLRN